MWREDITWRSFSALCSTCGSVLSSEADAIEMPGWKRSYRKIRGYRQYTFEYTAVEGEDKTITLN